MKKLSGLLALVLLMTLVSCSGDDAGPNEFTKGPKLVLTNGSVTGTVKYEIIPSTPRADSYDLWYEIGADITKNKILRGKKESRARDGTIEGLKAGDIVNAIAVAKKSGYVTEYSSTQKITVGGGSGGPSGIQFITAPIVTIDTTVNGIRCSWTGSNPAADSYEIYWIAGTVTDRDAIKRGNKIPLAASPQTIDMTGPVSVLVVAKRDGYADAESEVKHGIGTTQATTYTISYGTFTNGNVTGPATAVRGNNVTLTVAPGNGYTLGTLTVTGTGGAVGTTKATGTTHTFTMPAYNVNVTATFVVNNISNDYASENFDTSKCSFYDKFEGNTLDLDKWGYQNGNGAEYNVWGWGNNELQNYRPGNVTVSNGILRIEARRESYGGQQYTSGKIVTANSRAADGGNRNVFAQTYGRFEAKIRMSKQATGMWPAFWMMPVTESYGGWPRSGELDIMEMQGNNPTHASSTLHFQATYGDWSGHQYRGVEHTFENNSRFTDWHVYGMVWNADEVRFLIDGKQTRRLARTDYNTAFFTGNPSAPFNRDFHLIFNLAVDDNRFGAGRPNDAELPWAMEVDWVRCYTTANDPWTVTGNVPNNLLRNTNN